MSLQLARATWGAQPHRKSQRQDKVGTREGVRADVTVRLQVLPCCVL